MRLAFLLIVLLPWAAPACADEPTQPVEQLHEALLAAMRDGPRLGFDGRARYLARVIEQVYDMPGMTRTALGAGGTRLTPEQVQRITDAFTRYTVAVYARQFASWDDERFQTGAPSPAHGGGTLVPTRLIPATGEPVALTYLVRDDGAGHWRIADVLLDGTISQLAVRRAEFSALLKLKGADGLAESLEHRAAEQAGP